MSERERQLIRNTTARCAAFMCKPDLVALHIAGNGMDELLAEIDRTHPAPSAERAARAAGLREAADDMERVMAFGVMRIPTVGMAQTLRDKATAIEKGEIG